MFLLLISHEFPFYRITAEEWSRKNFGERFIASRNLGTNLAKILQKDENFYEWGNETGLYFYSKKNPPTGIFWLNHLLFPAPLRHELVERTLLQLCHDPPEVFIVCKDNIDMEMTRHPILVWFSTRYRPFPGDNNYFFIFMRKGGHLEQRVEKLK